ncbi:MAG: energy-coupling factor transporter ATPase [Firmicutes bacterium]|nr:energy-coupling factor transporter ATPase [Bacillota bacterium]
MVSIIAAEGLVFDYETSSGIVNALKGIDVEIHRGEYVAIIGPNGSGKSTLIKHFNALLTPTGGKVRVGDFSVENGNDVQLIRKNCGMVFQNPDNQIVATTVEEDVAFGPENLGIPSSEIRERVKEAMSAAGIAHLAKLAPHLLSGGEKQRVAIAGALAMRPSCLLLDEPTSLLDPRGQREIMGLLARLNEEKNMTIIHVTHSMEEAAEAARVMVMFDGLIVQEGPPGEVLGMSDRLKGWGLEAPVAATMAQRLRSAGFEVPSGVIRNDQLVEFLCS